MTTGMKITLCTQILNNISNYKHTVSKKVSTFGKIKLHEKKSVTFLIVGNFPFCKELIIQPNHKTSEL